MILRRRVVEKRMGTCRGEERGGGEQGGEQYELARPARDKRREGLERSDCTQRKGREGQSGTSQREGKKTRKRMGRIEWEGGWQQLAHRMEEGQDRVEGGQQLPARRMEDGRDRVEGGTANLRPQYGGWAG